MKNNSWKTIADAIKNGVPFLYVVIHSIHADVA